MRGTSSEYHHIEYSIKTYVFSKNIDIQFRAEIKIKILELKTVMKNSLEVSTADLNWEKRELVTLNRSFEIIQSLEQKEKGWEKSTET